MPIKQMDINVFEHLTNLKALQIEEISTVPFNLKNATGTGKMIKLETVSFKHNNLCRTINYKTFRGLTSVMRLFLSYSKIQSIGPGAFDAISERIHEIYLIGNLLKTLPNNLFDKLLIMPQSWKVYYSDNLWECDCNLSGLKKYTERNKKHFANPIVCITPQIYNGKFLTQISMCNCDDLSNDDKYDVLTDCPKSNHQEIINSYKKDHSYEISELNSYGQRVKIFHTINEDGISVSIYFTSNSYALIWFNHDRCSSTHVNENDDHCTSIYEKTIKISNITRNSTYTFCIINKGSQQLAPDNCLPYYVTNLDENSLQYRQVKDFAYIMVTIFLVLIIFALVFGIFFGICLARRYPSFINSSSSKILIQQIRHNEIWASSNNNNDAAKKKDHPEPSTQKKQKRLATNNAYSYNNIKEFNISFLNRFRPLVFRRRSDSSLASSQSYITAITPSPLDILHWKMDYSGTSDSLHSDLYDIDQFSLETVSTMHSNHPPPIPPYPKRKQKATTQKKDCNNLEKEEAIYLNF